jgi:transcriptional regulator with GAF, ATPase, and Fis domain
MFFLSRYARQFGRQVTGVAQETMARLINYAWPGNIRELQNLVERGVVLAQGPVLTLDHALLPDASLADASLAGAAEAGANSATPMSSVPSANYHQQAAAPPAQSPPALEDVERQHILVVLEQSKWVIEGERGAAKTLNLHPNTLRSRMKKLGIRRPSH